MSDSDPILVDREASDDDQRPVASWMLVAGGVVAGVALSVVFGLTGGKSPEQVPDRSVETEASVTTVSPTTSQVTVDESTPTVAIPEGLAFSPLLVVTGDYPDTGVERWSPDGVDEVLRLPWATNGFATDASGSLFAFSGQSATGRSLFVGRDDRYVVLSTTAPSWAWHATEPATLAWLDTSEGERTVSVTHLNLEPVGDRGEGLQTSEETTQLATAGPDERIKGFTSAGVVLGALNPGDAKPATRVIDLNGETVASTDTLLALFDGFSIDGSAVLEERQDGPTDSYMIAGSDLEEEFELGTYQLTSEGVAWSPDGQAVALVDYRGENDADFHLQVWGRDGESQLEMPLEHRVWGITWLPDDHLVMVGTDSSGWSGLLFIHPDTGELARVQAGKDPPIGLAIAKP
jgi:hypothetical protein